MSEPDIDSIKETPSPVLVPFKVVPQAEEETKTIFVKVAPAPPPEPSRAEVSAIVRAWVQSTYGAKRQFVKERLDEILRIQKEIEAESINAQDRWQEGDDAQ